MQSDAKKRRLGGEGAEEYFESYSDLNVHRLMLMDRPRMESYVRAIEKNRGFMEGKVCMDVGTGTGFLAMICVTRGGAKHVHAVEACPQVAEVARTLVSKNGLADRITIHAKPVEEITDEDLHGRSQQTKTEASDKEADVGRTVDVLVSEWMGFYLLHESMLESVLHARDRFLKPEGLLLPTSCRLFAAPLDLSRLYHERVSYFDDGAFYGLSGFEHFFSGLGEEAPSARAAFFSGEPNVELGVAEEELLSEGRCFLEMDLRKVKAEELQAVISGELSFVGHRPGLFGGVGIWFDCTFETRGGSASSSSSAASSPSAAVVLSTAPSRPATHWKQTIVFLAGPEGPIFAEVSQGEQLDFSLALVQSGDNPRHYDISLCT